MELKNSLFIFETEEDLINFWNDSIGKCQSNSTIERNTFIVCKDNWILKLIKFILRIRN